MHILISNKKIKNNKAEQFQFFYIGKSAMFIENRNHFFHARFIFCISRKIQKLRKIFYRKFFTPYAIKSFI